MQRPTAENRFFSLTISRGALNGNGLGFAIMTKDPDLDKTKRLMGALLRMPPKQHADMKIGRRKTKPSADKPERKTAKPSR